MVGLTTPATAIAAAAACALSGLGIWRKGGDRNASFSPEQIEAENAPASIGEAETLATTQEPTAVNPSEEATGSKPSDAVEGSPQWMSDAMWVAVVVDVVALFFAFGVCGARRGHRSRKAQTKAPNRSTSRPASAAGSPPRRNSTSPSKRTGSTVQEDLAEEEADASDVAAKAASDARAKQDRTEEAADIAAKAAPEPKTSLSQELNAEGAALLESETIQDQGEDCHAMPVEVADEENEEEAAQSANAPRSSAVVRDALFTLASPEADGGMLDKDCNEFVELVLQRFTSLEDAFIWMDVNRSGSLSMSEFLLLVRDVHFHGDVHKLWSVLDRNNNGLVSLHEFMSLHALQPAINARQGLPPPSPCKQDRACVPLAVLEDGHDALFVGAPEGVFHCGDDLAELELSEGDAEERVRRDARHGSLELSEGDDEENASFGDEGAKGCMSEEPEPLEQVATPLRRRSGAAVGFEL